MIRRLHIPLLRPEDVVPRLDAAHHWREGRSAKLLIDGWWSSNGFPPSVRELLTAATEWCVAEFLEAFAERKTDLADDRASASQSDLMVLCGLRQELGVVVVEAKVDEGFDRRVADWQRNASSGKADRLAKLCSLLGLDSNAVGSLRYQLFHRTASAIYEAQRFRARHAVMLVQSWCSEMTGFRDFSAFAGALHMPIMEPDAISQPRTFGGVSLRLGWISEVRSTQLHGGDDDGVDAQSPV